MRIPPAVAYALRANCGLRWMSGFLIMFMAFLLRENPLDGWSAELLTALVVGGAAAGNFLGRHRSRRCSSGSTRRSPSRRCWSPTSRSSCSASLFYGVLALALLGLVAGLGQALAKFSLDATIQRDVPAPGAGQRLRAQRHDAPAGLGDRRLHRHRDAARPAALGLGVAVAVLAAWSGVRAASAARADARRGPSQTGN